MAMNSPNHAHSPLLAIIMWIVSLAWVFVLIHRIREGDR